MKTKTTLLLGATLMVLSLARSDELPVELSPVGGLLQRMLGEHLITKKSPESPFRGALYVVENGSRLAVHAYVVDGKTILLNNPESFGMFVRANTNLIEFGDLPVLLCSFLLKMPGAPMATTRGFDFTNASDRESFLKEPTGTMQLMSSLLAEYRAKLEAATGSWELRYNVLLRDGSVVSLVADGRWRPFCIAHFAVTPKCAPGTFLWPMLGTSQEDFIVEESPNQAPDPTPLAVTPAACAPVAPACGRGSS